MTGFVERTHQKPRRRLNVAHNPTVRAFNQHFTPFFSDSMKYRAISNSSIKHRSCQQYEGHRKRAYTHASQMQSASNEKPLGAMPLAWRNTCRHSHGLDLLHGSVCVLALICLFMFPLCVVFCGPGRNRARSRWPG